MKLLCSLVIVSIFAMSCRNDTQKQKDQTREDESGIESKLKTTWWKDHESGVALVQQLKDLGRTEEATLAESKLQVEIQRSYKEKELRSVVESSVCFKSHSKENELLEANFSNRTNMFDTCLSNANSTIANISCFNDFNDEMTRHFEVVFAIANCPNPK